MSAGKELGAARDALERGSLRRACDAGWRAASAAAQAGDKATLSQVIELAAALVAAGAGEAAQLRVYAQACLEDAQKGTRPPSAFERLLSRDKRRR